MVMPFKSFKNRPRFSCVLRMWSMKYCQNMYEIWSEWTEDNKWAAENVCFGSGPGWSYGRCQDCKTRSQGFELLRSKSSGFDSTCPIDLWLYIYILYIYNIYIICIYDYICMNIPQLRDTNLNRCPDRPSMSWYFRWRFVAEDGSWHSEMCLQVLCLDRLGSNVSMFQQPAPPQPPVSEQVKRSWMAKHRQFSRIPSQIKETVTESDWLSGAVMVFWYVLS